MHTCHHLNLSTATSSASSSAQTPAVSSTLWVLVAEADVLATQGYALTRHAPDLAAFVRTVLDLHGGLAIATIGEAGKLSARRQPEAFMQRLAVCREHFHRKLLSTLSRLDARGEQGVPQRASLDSVLQYGASLLHYLERGGVHEASPLARPDVDVLRVVLGGLARQLAERLSAENVFYDAMAQSVRIPSDAELTVRRLMRPDDDLWLVPVTLKARA